MKTSPVCRRATKAAGRSHDLVGRRLPNLAVSGRSDAKNTFELLRRQYFVLIDLTGRVSLPQPGPGLRIEVATAETGDRPVLEGIASLLMRPDGHVAWVSDKPLDEHIPEDEIREWLNVRKDTALFDRQGAHAGLGTLEVAR